MRLLPRYVPAQNRTTMLLEHLARRLETTTDALVESVEAGRPYFVHSLKGGCGSQLVALGEIPKIIDQAITLGVDVASIQILDLSGVPDTLRRAAAAALN